MRFLSKENTVYQINEYGIITDVILMYNTYNQNNSLAVSMYYNDIEEPVNDIDGRHFGELYDVITINLHESSYLPFGVQFVDVNNHPGIVDWLINNKIAEPVPIYARSGFCVYPAVSFILTEEEKNEIQGLKIDQAP